MSPVPCMRAPCRFSLPGRETTGRLPLTTSNSRLESARPHWPISPRQNRHSSVAQIAAMIPDFACPSGVYATNPNLDCERSRLISSGGFQPSSVTGQPPISFGQLSSGDPTSYTCSTPSIFTARASPPQIFRMHWRASEAAPAPTSSVVLARTEETLRTRQG